METESEIRGKGYVHFKSWQETYCELVDAEYMRGITEERCADIAFKWRDNILVAKDMETVIGFVGYGAYRDDTLPGCGEIYSIYVLEEYQGKKVGFQLMNAALERLSDYKKIALWVLKGNNKAIEFYEKYGFCFDGTEQKIMLGTTNTEFRMIYDRGRKSVD